MAPGPPAASRRQPKLSAISGNRDRGHRGAGADRFHAADCGRGRGSRLEVPGHKQRPERAAAATRRLSPFGGIWTRRRLRRVRNKRSSPLSSGALQFQMRDGVYVCRSRRAEPNTRRPRIKAGRFGHIKSPSSTWKIGRQRGEPMISGGLWAENVGSAVARDLLVDAMNRLLMHPHDEMSSPDANWQRQRCWHFSGGMQ